MLHGNLELFFLGKIGVLVLPFCPVGPSLNYQISQSISSTLVLGQTRPCIGVAQQSARI